MIKKTKDGLKILLIYPPSGKPQVYNTPTGLLYIATVLKNNGYHVRFLDCSVEPDYRKILELEAADADLLGIYAMSVHIKYLLPELMKLRSINKRAVFIWGGPHATLFPEQTIKSPLADIVVRGEGEEVMLEIARMYDNGRIDLNKIKGISFKEEGRIITTPEQRFIDINKLPMLDWSFVKKESMDVIRKTIIRVQASRGCPYRCAFCINVVTNNRKMRYRDASNVLEEIEYLYKEYGIKRIGFRDEVFLSNRNQVRDIAAGILDKNIKITWLANPRAEHLKESYINDDYLKLLVESGCNKLQVGAESGSQRILDLLRKESRVEDTINFVKRAKKFNIVPVLSFMTGIPTETENEQMQTLRLIRDILRIYSRSFIVGPQNFRPYPGGELYEMCLKKYNLKMPGSLEEWSGSNILGGTRPPWVKRIYFNQFLWTSVKAASAYTYSKVWQKIFQDPLKGIGLLAMVIVSKFRLRYIFYKFPVEFRLLDWYHRFVTREIPELS